MHADEESKLEYKVKAAFLLNFTKFVEWPAAGASASAPFSICILGEDPFGTALESIVEGERVNGRRLVVQRVRPHEAQSCQVLFAGKGEGDLGKILQELRPGVLTVGEGTRFLHEGGMIAFVLESRRVRFDINQTAAARAGLLISSRLLNVARNVER